MGTTALTDGSTPDASCCKSDSLKCYRACTETYVMSPSRFHARSVVLDQVFVPDTTDSILDNGTMASLYKGPKGPDLVFNLWVSRVMTFRLKSQLLPVLCFL